ncbi:MAG: HNH endonuclease [Myxococcota bacterium]|nr:HNH endonuclease [Myxococcota bacterium]
MAPLKYTRELLAPIVASARSFSDVMRALGLPPNGGNHRLITSRIRQLELDISHFTYGRTTQLRIAVDDDVLVQLVRTCRSVAAVCRRLGLPEVGRPHRDLSAYILALGLDTTHFRGAAWSRGETKDTHPSIRRVWETRRIPDEKFFVANGPSLRGPAVIPRLLALGWRYACAWCEISEWRGKRLVLHIDHINGINNDNRLENLRLLCPNCHSQTDTYCNRRR